MRKIPKSDAFVLILVSLVTVFADLAVAVVVGVIVSALVLAWKASQKIHARVEKGEAGAKIYLLDGSLFFASVESFAVLFNPREDPDEVMPPSDHRKSLTKQEQQVLVEWVEQGATWSQHWAYVAPQRATRPSGNWIDAMIRQRLTQHGLKPAPAATKRVLVRRAYFDVTGLPPSTENVDAFLADVAEEVAKAVAKFPQPNPTVAAMCEEAGEVAKAALHIREGKSENWWDVYGEAVQLAAMACRIALEGDPTIGALPTEENCNLPTEENCN